MHPRKTGARNQVTLLPSETLDGDCDGRDAPAVAAIYRCDGRAEVRAAEDGWNSCNPERVSLAYAMDSYWRNRSEFVQGRAANAIMAFLVPKWAKELQYRLIKELWAFTGDRLTVRFGYEWHDDTGNWFRSYGNENCRANANGLMRRRRFACINDLPITSSERKYHCDRSALRPADHPGLTDRRSTL